MRVAARTRDVDAGDGLTLRIELSGTGPPLLLLHGFTGSAATWDSLREALDARFTIIAVDLPGHGRSSSPADYARFALHRLADDLASVLDTLGFERAGVLGYSMGGRAALEFALHYPARVAALLLESASPGIEDQHERAARVDSDMALADMIERDGMEAFVQFWEHLPIWSSRASLGVDERAAVRRQRLENDPAGIANSLRGAGAGARPSVIGKLGTLTMPTLLVAGSLDPKFVALARAMHDGIPDSRVAVVKGAGHTIHLERPAEFGELADAFFTRVALSHGWV